MLWRDSEISSCSSVNISYLMLVSFPCSVWCDRHMLLVTFLVLVPESLNHLQGSEVQSVTGLLSISMCHAVGVCGGDIKQPGSRDPASIRAKTKLQRTALRNLLLSDRLHLL